MGGGAGPGGGAGRGGAGGGGTGSPGSSCCLWPHCVPGSIIYPSQSPAPKCSCFPPPNLPGKPAAVNTCHGPETGIHTSHRDPNRRPDTQTRQTRMCMDALGVHTDTQPTQPHGHACAVHLWAHVDTYNTLISTTDTHHLSTRTWRQQKQEGMVVSAGSPEVNFSRRGLPGWKERGAGYGGGDGRAVPGVRGVRQRTGEAEMLPSQGCRAGDRASPLTRGLLGADSWNFLQCPCPLLGNLAPPQHTRSQPREQFPQPPSPGSPEPISRFPLGPGPPAAG